MMEKKNLATLVAEEAKKNVGVYNFIKDAEEKERKRTHNAICKALHKFSTENNFPMGVLVYIGVGTSAHKPSEFAKGYTKFDEKKVTICLELAEIFAAKFGANYRTNDRLIHTCSRYYTLNGGKVEFWKERVNALPSDFNMKHYNGKKIDTAKRLAEAIFGDTQEYTKGGYFVLPNNKGKK